MGLSIVKALVDRYEGKIWVENRVYDDYTRGSVFNILLKKP
jgi:signal transduction histidine kinase